VSIKCSINRGPFSTRKVTQPVLHPADKLASVLLGSASKVSLDVAGNKVEIDKPKSIPKAIKAAE